MIHPEPVWGATIQQLRRQPAVRAAYIRGYSYRSAAAYVSMPTIAANQCARHTIVMLSPARRCADTTRPAALALQPWEASSPARTCR
eukprot:1976697-Pyramimonas_sp.AAC.1